MKERKTVKFEMIQPDVKVDERQVIAVRREVEKRVELVPMNDLRKNERMNDRKLSYDISDWL